MTPHQRLIFSVLLAACNLSAQPFVYHRKVLNAASYAPAGLPSGSIAQGSIFSIFGRSLGPATPVKAETYPLGTTLGGVSIEVCKDITCVAAIPIYVSSGQLNAIMPSNTPIGPASLRVSLNGQRGNFSPVEIVTSSVGLFAINSGGFGPGVVTNFVDTATQPVNSSIASAKRGQVVTLWATGLGAALNADTVAPQAGDLPSGPVVFVGGKRVAQILYAGRSPCCSGLDQIVFSAPTDATLGCNVPVAVQTANGIVSNDVTIALTTNGQACDAEPLTAALLAGGRLGRIALARINDVGLSTTAVVEGGYAAFTEEVTSPWAFHPDFVVSPVGTCLTYLSRGSIGEITSVTTIPASKRRFDVGTKLTVTTSKATRVLVPRPLDLTGYLNLLGLSSSRVDYAPMLDPGTSVRVSVPGGPEIPGFDVNATPVSSPTWSNRSDIHVIDRSQDLQVTWAPLSASTRMTLTGVGRDDLTDSIVTFSCSLPAAEGRFTVPAHILRRIPAYRSGSARSGHTLVLSVEDLREFAAPAGLNKLFVATLAGVQRGVQYK